MPEETVSVPSTLVFGRETMTIQVLLKELHSASWPETVVLAPEDFVALFPPTTPREEDGTPYVYIGPTKISCHKSRPGLVDLSRWEPPRIIAPEFVGSRRTQGPDDEAFSAFSA